jgi:hypothetical protein
MSCVLSQINQLSARDFFLEMGSEMVAAGNDKHLARVLENDVKLKGYKAPTGHVIC